MKKLIISAIGISLMVLSCVPARQVEELKGKYAKCDDERRNLSSQNRELETTVTEQKEEINKMSKDIASLVKDTTLLGRSHRKMEEQYDKINKLNDELLKKQADLTKGSEAENRKLVAHLQETQERLQKKEDELKELARTLSAKEERLEKLNSDLEEREKKVKELQELIAEKDRKVSELKDKVTKALLGYQDKGLTVEQKDGRIYVSMEAKLLFPKGSTAIDKDGKAALKDLAGVLEEQKEIDIIVEGHTDSDPYRGGGAIKDNWGLSVLRATEVVRILLDNSDMDPTRLTAAGRGEFIPVDPGDSEEAKAKNRRIEVILTPDLDKLFQILGKDEEEDPSEKSGENN